MIVNTNLYTQLEAGSAGGNVAIPGVPVPSPSSIFSPSSNAKQKKSLAPQ